MRFAEAAFHHFSNPMEKFGTSQRGLQSQVPPASGPYIWVDRVDTARDRAGVATPGIILTRWPGQLSHVDEAPVSDSRTAKSSHFWAACAAPTFPDGADAVDMLPGGFHMAPRAPGQTEIGMSQTTPAPQPATPAQPPLVVNIQYVKDLSFEVPGAPNIYTSLRAQPQVAINLDVQARRIVEGGSNYEVTLMIRAEATDPAAPSNGQAPAPVVFIAELTYAGVFTLSGVPDNAVEPVLLVECPRILFPFARNILADVTRDGGFPPVLLQPIDFVQLWQTRRAQQARPAAPPVA